MRFTEGNPRTPPHRCSGAALYSSGLHTKYLWLYERMCASLPTGAAEGCGDRAMWKGSWSFIGSTWTWSLVWSFTEVSQSVSHVRETREVGRRGRGGVAVQGLPYNVDHHRSRAGGEAAVEAADGR